MKRTFPAPLAVIVALLTLIPIGRTYALDIVVRDPPQGSEATSILKRAANRLPPVFNKMFPAGFEVQIADLGPLPSRLGCAGEASPSTHGVVGRSPGLSLGRPKIQINSRVFLQPIEFCRFGTRDRYVQSVFFHEAAHHFDRRSEISKTSRYQGIARGFKAMHFRSPDSYEDTSAEESFAVNFEHRMLDTEYGCRRPLMQSLFDEVFHEAPARNCASNIRVTLNRTGESATVDPRSIYQIQYLVAGPGSSLISRFGHSFFRLVICAPERNLVGPECLTDTESHLVASFQALVTDKAFSLKRGFVGTYYQNVNFYRWSEIKSEYGYDEARTLDSYPLQLSRAQIRDFVGRLGEKHWSRFDRYTYAANNCSHESLRQLQDILPFDHPLQGEVGATPIALLDTFERTGLLSRNGNLSGPSEAEMAYRTGADDLASAERLVSKFLEAAINFETYRKLTNEVRATAMRRLKTARTETDRATIFAFFALEQRKFNEDSRAAIGRLIDTQKNTPEIRERHQKVQALNEQIMIHQRAPAGGYGIPLEREFTSSEAITKLIQNRDAEMILLYAELAEKSPADDALLEQTKQNLKYLTSLLIEGLP